MSETARDKQKLNLEIDRDLHTRVKIRAAEEARSMTRLIEDALERHLDGPPEPPRARRPRRAAATA